MGPSFLYSSTITALALASALARLFFLKHNLRFWQKKGKGHFDKWRWCSWRLSWCRITADSVHRRGTRSTANWPAGRWAWAGKQTQTRSRNWSFHSLENSWKAEKMFQGTGLWRFNCVGGTFSLLYFTFSTVRSGWDWGRCRSAWRFPRCWPHKECRSRILSTLSSDTAPPPGSPRMSSGQTGPPPLSFWEIK